MPSFVVFPTSSPFPSVPLAESHGRTRASSSCLLRLTGISSSWLINGCTVSYGSPSGHQRPARSALRCASVARRACRAATDLPRLRRSARAREKRDVTPPKPATASVDWYHLHLSPSAAHYSRHTCFPSERRHETIWDHLAANGRTDGDARGGSAPALRVAAGAAEPSPGHVPRRTLSIFQRSARPARCLSRLHRRVRESGRVSRHPRLQRGTPRRGLEHVHRRSIGPPIWSQDDACGRWLATSATQFVPPSPDMQLIGKSPPCTGNVGFELGQRAGVRAIVVCTAVMSPT